MAKCREVWKNLSVSSVWFFTWTAVENVLRLYSRGKSAAVRHVFAQVISHFIPRRLFFSSRNKRIFMLSRFAN